MLSRVRVIDTAYNEKHHIVFWKLKNIQSGDEISLAMRADELIQNLLNNPNIKVTNKEIIDFNIQIKGKEINWNASSISNYSMEFKDMNDDDWSHLNTNLDHVPINEVVDILREDNHDN